MPMNRAAVEELCAPLAQLDFPAFFARVSDDVHWTTVSPESKVFPVAGIQTKQSYMENFAKFSKCFAQPPTASPPRVIASDDGNTAVIEFEAHGVAKDGTKFDNYGVWVMEFDNSPQPMIKTVREYYDSALGKEILERNAQHMQ